MLTFKIPKENSILPPEGGLFSVLLKLKVVFDDVLTPPLTLAY